MRVPLLTKGDGGGFVDRGTWAGFFRMDPRHQRAGLTTGMLSAKPIAQFSLTLSVT